MDASTLLNLSLGTRRFATGMVVLGVLGAVTILGLIKGVDLIALSGPLTTIAGFGAAALGFGSSHDAKVRVAAARALDVPPAPALPPAESPR